MISSERNFAAASRVTEKRKTLGYEVGRKLHENLKTRWRDSLRPSVTYRDKASAIVVQNYVKSDIKVFCSCKILFHFFTCSEYFVLKCLILFCSKLLLTTHSSFLQTFILWPFLELQCLSQTFSTNTKKSNYKKVPNLGIFWNYYFAYVI